MVDFAQPGKYLLVTGRQTTQDDPRRLVWYSAHGCMWTDDWSKVATSASGVPVCPGCGVPGMMCTARQWFSGVTSYQAAGHPKYRQFIESIRGRCLGRGVDLAGVYQDWLAGEGDA